MGGVSCSQCEASGETCFKCHQEDRKFVEEQFNQSMSKYKHNNSKRRCINCSMKFSHKNSKIKINSMMCIPVCITCIDDAYSRYDGDDDIPISIMENFINRQNNDKLAFANSTTEHPNPYQRKNSTTNNTNNYMG